MFYRVLPLFVVLSLLIVPVAMGCSGSGYNEDYNENYDEGYEDSTPEPAAASTDTPSTPAPTPERHDAPGTVRLSDGRTIQAGGDSGFRSQGDFDIFKRAELASMAAEKMYREYFNQKTSGSDVDHGLVERALSKLDEAISNYEKALPRATGRTKAEIEEKLSDARHRYSDLVRER